MLFSIFVFTFRSPTETFALNERVRSKEINKDFPSFGPGITSELKKETKHWRKRNLFDLCFEKGFLSIKAKDKTKQKRLICLTKLKS